MRRSPLTRCAAGSRFLWSRTCTWRRSLTVRCWSAAGRSARVTWSFPASWRWSRRSALLLPPPPLPPRCPTPPCLRGAVVTRLITPDQVGRSSDRNMGVSMLISWRVSVPTSSVLSRPVQQLLRLQWSGDSRGRRGLLLPRSTPSFLPVWALQCPPLPWQASPTPTGWTGMIIYHHHHHHHHDVFTPWHHLFSPLFFLCFFPFPTVFHLSLPLRCPCRVVWTLLPM